MPPGCFTDGTVAAGILNAPPTLYPPPLLILYTSSASRRGWHYLARLRWQKNSPQDRVDVGSQRRRRGKRRRGFQSRFPPRDVFMSSHRVFVGSLARSTWGVCLSDHCERIHFKEAKKIDLTKNKEQNPEWGSCQENEVGGSVSCGAFKHKHS